MARGSRINTRLLCAQNKWCPVGLRAKQAIRNADNETQITGGLFWKPNAIKHVALLRRICVSVRFRLISGFLCSSSSCVRPDRAAALSSAACGGGSLGRLRWDHHNFPIAEEGKIYLLISVTLPCVLQCTPSLRTKGILGFLGRVSLYSIWWGWAEFSKKVRAEDDDIFMPLFQHFVLSLIIVLTILISLRVSGACSLAEQEGWTHGKVVCTVCLIHRAGTGKEE